MEKSKELILIRYISLVVLLCQMGLSSKSILGVISALIIVLNNNLRLYYLKKEGLKFISVIGDVILVGIEVYFLGGIALFGLIGAMIDSISLENFKKKCIGIGLVFLLIVQEAYKQENFVYLGITLMLIVILNYINNLYKTKIDAQKLYDKLRVSEERLKEMNRELEGYVLSIEELTLLKERNRISREIHDSVGHALSTSMIQLSAMEAIATKEESKLAPMAKNLREFINISFQDVKKAVREIKPTEYGEYEGILKIQEIYKNFEKMTGVKINFTVSKNVWKIDDDRMSHLYRISQEILSNALRHGKATSVNIVMNFMEEEVILSFKDNGQGAEKIKETGVGLKSIKERSKEIGGNAYISSKYGDGFFIKINMPREREIKL